MVEAPTRRPWVWLVVIGVVAGFMSGMFGVGGGIIIVPALIYLAKLDPKLASGTSLLAIFPVAIVGMTTYAIDGHVDLWLALILAVGSILGAPLGTWLLARVSKTALQLAFIAFIIVVVVSLFIVIPSRDAEVDITWLTGPLLFVLGFVVGILSGLLGIGGGVVIVPMLMLLFGSSDLVAKGSSLLMMIGTSISGTWGNLRRKNCDVPSAVVVGVGACVTTSLGALTAAAVTPLIGNIAFAVFLVLVAGRMLVDVIRARRAGGKGA